MTRYSLTRRAAGWRQTRRGSGLVIGQSTIDINFESKGVNVLTIFFWLARQGEREAGGKSVREAGLPVGGLGVAQVPEKARPGAG